METKEKTVEETIVKKFLAAAGLLILLSLAACSAAGLMEKKPEYAIIMKSGDNQYNKQVADAFCQAIGEAGYRCEALYPESAKAQAQVVLVRRMMREGVKAIAIAASDEHALAPVLKEAMAKGIVVTTLDSDTEADSRTIYVSPADPAEIGAGLVCAAKDCMDGKGQWAILSAQVRSANQTGWIHAMRKELEKTEYQNMRLVDIVYGEDDYETSAEKTRQLIKDYPDIKVICALTTVGSRAAVDVIRDCGLERDIKVTGLGLPSEMADDVGYGEDDVCPVLYLWSPDSLGRLSAQISVALANREFTVREGVAFETGDGGSYPVHEGAGGGLEVTAGDPLALDETNIGLWKDEK